VFFLNHGLGKGDDMSVSERLSNLLSQRLGIEPFENNKDWNDEFKSFDSLDKIDLLYAIEDEFKIKLNVETMFDDFDDLSNQIKNISS
jgi:acyl carrier protein